LIKLSSVSVSKSHNTSKPFSVFVKVKIGFGNDELDIETIFGNSGMEISDFGSSGRLDELVWLVWLGSLMPFSAPVLRKPFFGLRSSSDFDEVSLFCELISVGLLLCSL